MGKRNKQAAVKSVAYPPEAPQVAPDGDGMDRVPESAPEPDSDRGGSSEGKPAGRRVRPGMVLARAVAPNTYGGMHRSPGDVYTMPDGLFESMAARGQVERA